MAKQTKSRVSKTSSKKSGFQFRWWMALVGIIIIAGIGIVVIRLSQASARGYAGTVQYFNLSQGAATVNISGFGPVNFVRYPGNTLNGNIPGWSSDYYGWCASIQKGFSLGLDFTGIKVGDRVFVAVYDGKNAQSCYGEASVN